MTIAKVHRVRRGSLPRRAGVAPSRSRQLAEARGRAAELAAAVLLTLKGYRILARRERGPFGEIDIIAARGRRLAFIEVKQRSTEDAANCALTAVQAERMSNAAERWLWRNPRYREHRIGLDAIVMGAYLLPRHIPDALHAW